MVSAELLLGLLRRRVRRVLRQLLRYRRAAVGRGAALRGCLRRRLLRGTRGRLRRDVPGAEARIGCAPHSDCGAGIRTARLRRADQPGTEDYISRRAAAVPPVGVGICRRKTRYTGTPAAIISAPAPVGPGARYNPFTRIAALPIE